VPAGEAGRRRGDHLGRVGALTAPVDRLREFFGVRIWDVRLADLSRPRAALYRVLRIVYSAVCGYFENRISIRAAALTYFSVLSVVPFLGFGFAILKGVGAYQALIGGTVRPWLHETFAPNPPLYEGIERVLQFVDQTDVSRLGTAGVIFLVYTSISLVSSVETVLNDLFGARTRRPVLRQVTDYVTLLVVAPLLFFVAATLSAAAQSSRFVLFLRDRLGLGGVIDFGLGLAPVLVTFIALFGMYLLLPNVKVRPLSAALGAAVAAIAWQAALVLHVQLQVGVAKYNALYSFLGAIPIFLIWVYLSWTIVFVGAQLAASHQNEAVVRQHLGRQADQALRESLAIAAAAQVARDFVAGGPRRTIDELARRLEVTPAVMEGVVDPLVRAGLLAPTPVGDEMAYLPARDLDQVRASDVRDALRRDPAVDRFRAGVEQQLGPGLRRVLDAEEEERRTSPHNPTLRELAAIAREAPAPVEEELRPRRGEGGGNGGSDARRPDLPA